MTLSITKRKLLQSGFCALCCSRPVRAAEALSCVRFQAQTKDPNSAFKGLQGFDYSYDFMNGLVPIIAEISSVFGVQASFGFYDDPVLTPNAAMTNTALLPLANGSKASDGTIAVGRHLINALRSQSRDFGSSITAVCSHEYGHVLQYKIGLIDRLLDLNRGDLPVELHADYLCGYFGARRKILDNTYNALTQAETQFKYGDNDKRAIAIGHGTPDQRGNAVYAGYLMGKSGEVDPKTVAEMGFKYIKELSL